MPEQNYFFTNQPVNENAISIANSGFCRVIVWEQIMQRCFMELHEYC